MKTTLLLLSVVAVASALQGFHHSQRYVDGEYIIGFNNPKHLTDYHLKVLSNNYEENYKVTVEKIWSFANAKMMLVKGSHSKVMKMKSLSEVKYIEQNQIYSIQQSCESVSANECWGLDRTDQRAQLSYDQPLSEDAVYDYGMHTGSSVWAYIADTGIDRSHSDFGGRAHFGFAVDGFDNPEGDGNGHGTHCAGTVGSASYGLAKEVTLIAVKVLRDGGFGSTGGIIDGLQWIQGNHTDRGSGAKSVVNMSLGGGASQALDDAVAECVAAGVVVVVAAGNSDRDACRDSPAREPTAITVGATEVDDRSASFTNWGSCLDVFAPGVRVKSTTPGDETDVFSGTSMAAPHVAGAVARYLDSQDNASPDDVDDWVKSTGTVDAIDFRNDDHATSDNLLLYAPCEL